MAKLGYAYRKRARIKRRGGVDDSWLLNADFYGKEKISDISPYLIPNEVIAGCIAHYLKLSLPLLALMKSRGGAAMTMFASLQFARLDSEPDDFRPKECYRKMPDLCTGIVLFDILIANADRHRWNIQTDSASDPALIRIIDHDRALFGVDGVPRLQRLKERLGISGGSVTHDNRHCLIDHLSDADLMWKWRERIAAIPEWFIKETCDEVRGIGARKAEVEEAAKFLIYRKNNLSDIVLANKNEFNAINCWGIMI